MQTFKQFLTEAAGFESVFGNAVQRQKFINELRNVTEDVLVASTYEPEDIEYDQKKDTITIPIAYEGDEDLVVVDGSMTFVSPTECVVDIREWSATGKIDDYYEQFGTDEDAEELETPKEILGRLGVEYKVHRATQHFGGFYTIYGDVSKLRSRKIKIEDVKQFAQLCQLFDDIREESPMWEGGSVKDMFHVIDLSKLEKYLDQHKA